MPRFLNRITAAALRLTGGTPGSGKVITGDSQGEASWNYVADANVSASAGIQPSKLASGSPNQIIRAGQTGTPEFAYLALDVPIGTVVPYMFPNAPVGFLICDGSILSRTGYADLFALANSAGLIGTVFGAGDGSTTFSLPDMRGRTIVGVGTHSDVSTLGTSDNLAVASRTPKHTHDVPAHYHGMGSGSDLNVASSGAHTHTVSDPGHTHTNRMNGGLQVYRVNVASGSGEYGITSANTGSIVDNSTNTTGVSVNSTNSAHTHGANDFAGRIGLVTGGSDGNVPMTSGTTTVPYIALNYIIKATYSTLLGDSNAEANEAFTVFMGS